jgi:23S rRNA pseudouridine1911/1915/1917 synthase
MPKFEFHVAEEMKGLRLDQCLARSVEPLSRSSARVALDLGAVFIDGKRVKVASRKVMPGQHVVVHLGGAFERAHKQVGRAARALDDASLPKFQVLFEDEHLVAVHKPPGLLSAPTPEGDTGNLQSLLERRDGQRTSVFVVHRLDLQTSGVLVYAKTKAMNHALGELFRSHDLIRRYDVFAAGQACDEAFSVRHSLSGKPAVTHFRRIAQHATFCRLEATLETGRTHQIRRHLLQCGLPVLADVEYSRREPWHPPRLALHAKHLSFSHPIRGAPLVLDAPLPDDLDAWLRNMIPAPPEL